MPVSWAKRRWDPRRSPRGRLPSRDRTAIPSEVRSRAGRRTPGRSRNAADHRKPCMVRRRLDNARSERTKSRAVLRPVLLVALFALSIVVPAIGAEHGPRIRGEYGLTGSSEIDAQVGPMPFRRTAHPVIEVRAESAEGGRVTLTVLVDGRLCNLVNVTTAT